MAQKPTPELEEYLEAIVRCQERSEQPKVKNLAKELGVSPASVSEMLRKLRQKGLIRYESYGRIELTEKGESLGISVLRKHRILEAFLRFIGINQKKVHKEACVLEHAVSDEVEQALASAMEQSLKKGAKKENLRTLLSMKSGEKGLILFISGGRASSKRLTNLGLTPGTIISVERHSTRAGPVGICARNVCLAIGRGLAEKIYVEVLG